MKFIIYIGLSVVMLTTGCQNQTEKNLGLKVSGLVKKLNPGFKIYLEEIDGSTFRSVDSTQIGGDQRFEFTVNLSEPSFYRLNFDEKQYVNFILNDTDVVINADGDKQIGFAEVIGSSDTDYFFEISDLRENFQRNLQNLNSQFMLARNSGDMQTVIRIQQQYVLLEYEFQKSLKQKIWDIGQSCLKTIGQTIQKCKFLF